MNEKELEKIEEKQEKREIVLDLLNQLEEKIGEALEIYKEVEDSGFSDHYLLQELDFNYMDSIPQKIDSLRKEVEEEGDEE